MVQRGTFLDHDYEHIATMNIPQVISERGALTMDTVTLPEASPVQPTGGPLLLYHPWSLDPLWHQGEHATRILVLEPSHTRAYPMSPKRWAFLLDLARNIPDLQIWHGEVADLQILEHHDRIISREHPFTEHFPGIKEERARLFPRVNQHFSSFTGFWKFVEKTSFA